MMACHVNKVFYLKIVNTKPEIPMNEIAEILFPTLMSELDLLLPK